MKAKLILSLVITLIIGFFLGMLTSANLRHKKMRSVRMYSSERYFRDVIYRVIEPSDKQIKQLEPIIKSFGKEGNEIQKDFREEFDDHNSRCWEEIRSFLTDKQIELLDESFRKRKEEFNKYRSDTLRRGRQEGRRGPPSHHMDNDSIQKGRELY